MQNNEIIDFAEELCEDIDDLVIALLTNATPKRRTDMKLQFFIGESGVFRVSKREPDESFIECIYRDDDNDST